MILQHPNFYRNNDYLGRVNENNLFVCSGSSYIHLNDLEIITSYMRSLCLIIEDVTLEINELLMDSRNRVQYSIGHPQVIGYIYYNKGSCYLYLLQGVLYTIGKLLKIQRVMKQICFDRMIYSKFNWKKVGF